MLKALFKNIGVALLVIMVVQAIAYAQPTGETEPDSPQSASFKSRCENLPAGYPPCANAPSECGSAGSDCGYKPFNCIFLEEPIGGRTGYDLYKVTCSANSGAGGSEGGGEGEGAAAKCPSQSTICETTLWYGEAIVGNVRGPIQAVLAYEPGNETQGPFGLLYNYLGLVYNFLSGIIIGFVVLVSIIGGIRMTTSAGNQESFSSGKNMIVKALIGMVLWFTASVILYTINPTFFAF